MLTCKCTELLRNPASLSRQRLRLLQRSIEAKFGNRCPRLLVPLPQLATQASARMVAETFFSSSLYRRFDGGRREEVLRQQLETKGQPDRKQILRNWLSHQDPHPFQPAQLAYIVKYAEEAKEEPEEPEKKI